MNLIKSTIVFAAIATLPCAAQQYKIAVAGMQHGHIWLNIGAMLQGDKVKLVGVADERQEQRDWAINGAPVGYTRGKPGPHLTDASLIFSDWRKMIDQTKPDIVWAFTPTNEHVQVVEYCAPRGIHVIVEKPLAATYKEALRIQALARKHKTQVLANYGSTWQPNQYAIKAAVDAGAIGRVWRLRSVTGGGGPGDPAKSAFAAWLADPIKNGGGALMDFGCYGVNWVLWMKGRPESVFATLDQIKPEIYPRVDDHATMTLKYKDGLAILEASWAQPPAPRGGNEIYGRNGSIVGGPLRKAGGGRGIEQGEPIKADPLPPERAEPIAYLVNRLQTGQPLDGPSALELNVAVNEVLEAAKISARTGKSVRLPLRGSAR